MGAETTYAAILIAIVSIIPPTIAAVSAALAARHAANEAKAGRATVVAAAQQASLAVGHAQTAVQAATKQSEAIHRLVSSNLSTLREELKIKDRRIEIQHDDLIAKEAEIAALNTRNEQLHAIIEQLKLELQAVTRSEQSSEGDR